MNHMEVPASLAKKLSFWGWFIIAPHTALTMAHVIPWRGAAANVEGLEPFPTTQVPKFTIGSIRLSNKKTQI